MEICRPNSAGAGIIYTWGVLYAVIGVEGG